MIFTLELKLGIAGTAKNTGKTTVTAAIMDELRRRGVPFYLTSIGYDGENLDNVTGLPKPKLPVQVGDIVATAEKCLLASTARFETLAQTGVNMTLRLLLRSPFIVIGATVMAFTVDAPTAGAEPASTLRPQRVAVRR